MAGETEKLALNAIARFSHSADFQLYFEEILGFKPTAQHRDEIAALRQKVQQTIADTFEGLVFLKTHNALVNDRGHPVFNFAVTSGAVYIVRNPLDVAISLAHHGGYSIDKAIETMALEDSESPVDDKLVHEIWSSWSRMSRAGRANRIRRSVSCATKTCSPIPCIVCRFGAASSARCDAGSNCLGCRSLVF